MTLTGYHRFCYACKKAHVKSMLGMPAEWRQQDVFLLCPHAFRMRHLLLIYPHINALSSCRKVHVTILLAARGDVLHVVRTWYSHVSQR